MILVIDTTIREKFELTLADKAEERCYEFETENQADDILPAIDGILKNNKLSLKNIKAVLVNQGPGSFTGVRVGVTIANTLGWTLDIPIYPYKEGNREEIINNIIKNQKSKFSKIVLPYYI